MSDFLEVSVENVIKESKTTKPELCNIKYIIYLDIANLRKKVRVNTYYNQNGDTIKLCRYYDRGLCNTLEEYKELDLDYIESQAYGSWMDGAR